MWETWKRKFFQNHFKKRLYFVYMFIFLNIAVIFENFVLLNLFRKWTSFKNFFFFFFKYFFGGFFYFFVLYSEKIKNFLLQYFLTKFVFVHDCKHFLPVWLGNLCWSLQHWRKGEVHMNLMPPGTPKVYVFFLFCITWAASVRRLKSLPKSNFSNLIFLFFLYRFIYYKEFYSFIYL